MQTASRLSAQSVNTAARKAQEAVDADLGITAVVLATLDGFTVASAMRPHTDAARLAALAVSIGNSGTLATREAGLGRCTSCTLHGEWGYAVVRQLSVDGMALVLIMVADGSGLLAQVMYQVNQISKDLAGA